MRLTLGTEMRAPAGQDGLLDGLSTTPAGLSRAPIHAQTSAKLPHVSMGIAVITKGRAPRANGLFQHATDLAT